MPDNLLETMTQLNSENWDIVEKSWKNGEVEKEEYNKKYIAQKANLALGNRTFGENNQILSPKEFNNLVDQRILKEANDLAKQEKIEAIKQQWKHHSKNISRERDR